MHELYIKMDNLREKNKEEDLQYIKLTNEQQETREEIKASEK